MKTKDAEKFQKAAKETTELISKHCTPEIRERAMMLIKTPKTALMGILIAREQQIKEDAKDELATELRVRLYQREKDA